MPDVLPVPIARQTPGMAEFLALVRRLHAQLDRHSLAELAREHARLVCPRPSSEVKR